MSKRHVAIFTRAPVAGKTKTRLIPLLGAEGAAYAGLPIRYRDYFRDGELKEMLPAEVESRRRPV